MAAAALVVLCSPDAAGAQEAATAQNVFYAEAFGNALQVGSVNYERMLTRQFSLRVGASPHKAFPLLLNYLPGGTSHRIEIGAGLLAVAADKNSLGTMTVGYRYQPRSGGAVFRTGWTPLVGTRGVATWFGFSLGAAF